MNNKELEPEIRYHDRCVCGKYWCKLGQDFFADWISNTAKCHGCSRIWHVSKTMLETLTESRKKRFVMEDD